MSVETSHRFGLANGIKIEFWGQDQRFDNAARQLAGALPRAADGVRKVEAGVPGSKFEDATIWLEPETDSYRAFSVPEGWRVIDVGLHDDGTVSLDVQREGSA